MAPEPTPPVDATAPSSDPWRWRTLEGPVTEAMGAVALDPDRSILALGDADGLSLRRVGDDPVSPLPDSGWRRIRLPAPVVDLAFASDGSLWAATPMGLWQVDPDGRSRERSPAPGDEARRVHRVIVVGSNVFAATDAGLYAQLGERAWKRVVDGLPEAPVVAMAVRATPPRPSGSASLEVFAIAEARLWRLSLDPDAGAGAIGPARRVEIPGQPAHQPPVDVVLDVAGDAVVVLFTQAIARTLPAGSHALRWEVIYPVFVPGSIALRLFVAAGGIWLASDQGLMAPDPWPTRWRRSDSPAGHTPIVSLAGSGNGVYAVAPSMLLFGQRPPAPGPGRPATGARVLPVDPDLRRVHEIVLERAGLEPAYFEGLRRRIGRRGWVPAVSLRAGAGYGVDDQGDYDESFTYGQLQQLNDRFSGRSSDFEGSLTFVWDLADVVYSADAPDLSREARQVVTLRDNVLDEVNQLYFDRRRALAALAVYADRSDPEAVALEIRCQELAAGLDAWTGGWFSQAIEARP